MKTQLSALALLLLLSGFGSLAMANENQGLDKSELDKINAYCKEDARDAETPEWYAQECVDEGIQALKEEKGLAQPAKEES